MFFSDEACLGLQNIENSTKTSECIEQNLPTIERGLLLVKNHLDSFQNRHSFQLRQWQLKNQEIADVMNYILIDIVYDRIRKYVTFS